jgi:hypothetical protein
MAQEKKKVQEAPSKRRSQAKPLPVAASEEDKQVAALLHAWQEEIAELRSVTFNSREEAFRAVADRVLQRLSGGAVNEHERGFLETLIETDPDLQEVLGKSLSIKER